MECARVLHAGNGNTLRKLIEILAPDLGYCRPPGSIDDSVRTTRRKRLHIKSVNDADAAPIVLLFHACLTREEGKGCVTYRATYLAG